MGSCLLLVAPFWPGRVWFSDLISLLDGSPWEIPVRRDLLSQVEGMILHPRLELWKLWVWPLRLLRPSSNLELPQRGNCTPWSGDSSLHGAETTSFNPVNCPIGTVLEFLQASFSTGLSHSTLKVYVAAMAANHAPLGGQSVGRDPLPTRFLHGVMRLRPQVRSSVPPWKDVLNG